MENKQNTKVYMVCIKNESTKKIYDVKVFDYNFRTNTDLVYFGTSRSKESYEELLRHKIICNEQIMMIRVIKISESIGKSADVKITHERRFPDSLIVSKALGLRKNQENLHSDYMDEQGILDSNGDWVPFTLDNYCQLVISEIKPYTSIELHLFVLDAEVNKPSDATEKIINPLDFMKGIEKEIVEGVEIAYDNINENPNSIVFDIEQEIEDKLVEMRNQRNSDQEVKSKAAPITIIEAKGEDGQAIFFNDRGELMPNPLDLDTKSFNGMAPVVREHAKADAKNRK